VPTLDVPKQLVDVLVGAAEEDLLEPLQREPGGPVDRLSRIVRVGRKIVRVPAISVAIDLDDCR